MYYKCIHFLEFPSSARYSASSQSRIPTHNREIDSIPAIITACNRSNEIHSDRCAIQLFILRNQRDRRLIFKQLKDPLRMRRFSLDAIAASKITLTEIRRINEGGRGRCYQSSWMTAVNREPMKFHSKPL